MKIVVIFSLSSLALIWVFLVSQSPDCRQLHAVQGWFDCLGIRMCYCSIGLYGRSIRHYHVFVCVTDAPLHELGRIVSLAGLLFCS